MTMKSDDIFFHGGTKTILQSMPERAAGTVKEIEIGHGGQAVRQAVQDKTRR